MGGSSTSEGSYLYPLMRMSFHSRSALSTVSSPGSQMGSSSGVISGIDCLLGSPAIVRWSRTFFVLMISPGCSNPRSKEASWYRPHRAIKTRLTSEELLTHVTNLRTILLSAFALREHLQLRIRKPSKDQYPVDSLDVSTIGASDCCACKKNAPGASNASDTPGARWLHGRRRAARLG